MAATPVAAAGSNPAITTSSPPRMPSDISATVLRARAPRPRARIFDLVRQVLRDARDQRRGPRVDSVRMRDHERLADHRRAAVAASPPAPALRFPRARTARRRPRRARFRLALRIRKRSPFVMIDRRHEARRRCAPRGRDRTSAADRRRARDRPCARAPGIPRPPAPRCRCPRGCRISAPAAERSASAWRAAATEMISPSQGARSSGLVGIDRHAVAEHALARTAASGTSSSGAHQPASGARMIDASRQLPTSSTLADDPDRIHLARA